MIIPTLDFEIEAWKQGFTNVAGVDEVGRGCFAGPVVVGAVIFPKDVNLPEGIRDSKLLTPKKRKDLDPQIKNIATAWSIEEVGIEIINELGIGQATQLAFLNVIKKLKFLPDYILIDAFFIDGIEKEKQKPIIHGDALSMSIAAASIIAKVYRDELMEKLHEQYPQYNFAKHKGYGTKEHRDAIKKHGLSPLHRTSFNLTKFL